MKIWSRLRISQFCNGPCGRRMLKGEPVLEFHIQDLTRVPRRCAACAGEPVPDDLPEVTVRPAIGPLTMHRFSVDMLPLDFKMAAAGREPGEDG